jgi:hypothetical protein
MVGKRNSELTRESKISMLHLDVNVKSEKDHGHVSCQKDVSENTLILYLLYPY